MDNGFVGVPCILLTSEAEVIQEKGDFAIARHYIDNKTDDQRLNNPKVEFLLGLH